jgi:hypothetical protein
VVISPSLADTTTSVHDVPREDPCPRSPTATRELLTVIGATSTTTCTRAWRTPGFFTFYENWVSGEKLDAHFAAPHFVELAAKRATSPATPG